MRRATREDNVPRVPLLDATPYSSIASIAFHVLAIYHIPKSNSPLTTPTLTQQLRSSYNSQWQHRNPKRSEGSRAQHILPTEQLDFRRRRPLVRQCGPRRQTIGERKTIGTADRRPGQHVRISGTKMVCIASKVASGVASKVASKR